MTTPSVTILNVTWFVFKAAQARVNSLLFYVDRRDDNEGYHVYGANQSFIDHSIVQGSDLTDFETNYKPGATEVSSADDAIASLINPPVSYSSGSDGSQPVAISVSSDGKQKIVNYDLNNNVIAPLQGSVIPVTQGGFLVAGTDGTNARIMKVNTDGSVQVSFATGNSINIKDSSGNSLNSTSGDLNVSLRDSAGTAITLSGGNLKSSLFDSSGNAAILTDNQLSPGSYGVVVVGGNDGSNIRDIAVDSTGRLKVDLFDNAGNALNSTTNALNVSIRDGAGNTLSSTSNKLDVGLTGANTVKLTDSAGTSITLNTGGSLKQTIYDPAGNPAVGTKGTAFPATTGVVFVGGSDGTNAQSLAMTTGGLAKVALSDGSANAITSTSSALDINIKSVTGTNLPISIAAQTLAAVAISRTNTANAVANPIFVELSDGAAALGTTGNPIFVNNKDGSGNALTSTSNKLDVGLTGANTVKLNDSAGTAITLSGANLKTSLFDSAGDAAVVLDAVASPASRGVVMVAGNDGSNIRLIATDSSGRQKVDLFDNAGNALNSTTNALNVSLRDSAGTAITLNAGGSLKDTIYDASGNVAVGTKGAAFPGTAGLVLIGGSDGTNAQTPTVIAAVTALPATTSLMMVGGSDGTNARSFMVTPDGLANPVSLRGMIMSGTDGANTHVIRTDTSGRIKNVEVDANGNTISMLEGATVTSASQGALLVAGWDGSKAHIIRADTNGNAQTSVVNRDGARSETAFGQLKVAQEDIILGTSFALGVFPNKINRYVEGPGAFSFAGGALRMDAGTSVSRVRINTEQNNYYVAGAGVHIMMSVILSDTGAAGCVRRFGAMDDVALNGYFFQLNGTTLQICRRVNGTDTTLNASSWNLISTITPDTNGHIWEVAYQWLGVGRIIFRRDGLDVHTIEYAGTSSSLSAQTPNMVPFMEIQNTSAQGAGRTMDIGSIHISYENANSRKAGAQHYYASTTTVPSTVTNGTEHGVLALQFRASKQGLNNSGIASIKRITVVTSGSQTANVDIRLRKNPQFGATTTFTADEAPNAPSTDWGSTVPTATVSATSATGTGYTATQNLAYKITGVGNFGETVASTVSGTVSSGSPAKQINLSWPGISNSSAYNIYRQIAGAGSFLFIGTTTDVTFTDNAFIAGAGTPPGASTAEGFSWMSVAEDLNIGDPGFTSGTGRTLSLVRLNSAQTWVQEYGNHKLVLLPGETFMITMTPTANNIFATAIIEWNEGAPE